MTDDTQALLKQLLAEQRIMAAHIAKLASELRTRKAKAQKRTRSIVAANAAAPLAGGPPTALELAAMRRRLAR